MFEPNAPSVLAGVLPHYVHFQVYQMIRDSRASEHSARMVAMKNATDNAKQTHQGPDARIQQGAPAAITTEILESPPRKSRSANLSPTPAPS